MEIITIVFMLMTFTATLYFIREMSEVSKESNHYLLKHFNLFLFSYTASLLLFLFSVWFIVWGL